MLVVYVIVKKNVNIKNYLQKNICTAKKKKKLMSNIRELRRINQGCMSLLSIYLLEYGRHHRRHVARLLHRCPYAPTSSTASHYNHEKINSWVSFRSLYGYWAPLGGPSHRWSSAKNVVAFGVLCIGRGGRVGWGGGVAVELFQLV